MQCQKKGPWTPSAQVNVLVGCVPEAWAPTADEPRLRRLAVCCRGSNNVGVRRWRWCPHWLEDGVARGASPGLQQPRHDVV
jgi:hypothetical protein